MKFKSNDDTFFVISNSYIDHIIKKKEFRTFFTEYKDKYEIVIKIKFKEID